MLHGGPTSRDCTTCDGPPSVRRRHSTIGRAADYICRGLNREHRKMCRSSARLVLVQVAPAKPVKDRNHLVTHATLKHLQNADLRLHVGTDSIAPSEVVRDLGVFLNSELTMWQHMGKVASLCYYHLRRLKKVCRILGLTITSRLVSAFVTSRLDYCKALLAGVPQSTIAQLQRVQNAAIRLVSNLRPRDKVSASLREFYWLLIRYRINYKLCLMMHNAHVGRSPCYVTEMLTATVHLPNRSRLRSSASIRYELPTLRRKIGERAFLYSGPESWNSLPSDITSLWTFQHLELTWKRII